MRHLAGPGPPSLPRVAANVPANNCPSWQTWHRDTQQQQLDTSKLIHDVHCVVCTPQTHGQRMSAELRLWILHIESCLPLWKVPNCTVELTGLSVAMYFVSKQQVQQMIMFTEIDYVVSWDLCYSGGSSKVWVTWQEVLAGSAYIRKWCHVILFSVIYICAPKNQAVHFVTSCALLDFPGVTIL